MNIDKIPELSYVKLVVNGTEFKGRLLPKEGEAYVLKMDSGYNVGILAKNVESAEILDEKKLDIQKDNSKSEIKQDDTLPKIKILHTGGTIASKVDYKTGAVSADFTPEALLELFPELTEIGNIESEFLGNMFSDDFRFAHFNKIATKVLDGAKKGIRKFIVTSGTDYLHYLSAALSFILKDVQASVLVVGAQRSSDRGSSDAGMNLIGAASFLAQTNYKIVAACMHATIDDKNCNIIQGTHARKMHSSRRDAFESINLPVLATINYETKKIDLKSELKNIDENKELFESLPLFKEEIKVGLLYGHPNMFAEEILAYKHFDGLVLAGSGLGHFPITEANENCKEHKKIHDAIKKIAKHIPTVMSVQTIRGKVHMNVYAPGRELQEMGVIGQGSVMTPETSFVKLAWLLSNPKLGRAQELFMVDMVDELNNNESNKLL